MSREVHVRFCESGGVQFPSATHLVILVRGTREQADAVRDEAARVLHDELEMELSEEKTLITHVDEGFDFLGHRIRRVAWRKSKVAFTYPSKRSVEAVKYKVKSLTTRTTTHLSLRDLLLHLNAVLRGWAMYFRYDASKRTLAYVDNFAWWRVFRWLRKKHPTRNIRYLQRRYCGGRWWIHEDGVELFRPSKVSGALPLSRDPYPTGVDGADRVWRCRPVCPY